MKIRKLFFTSLLFILTLVIFNSCEILTNTIGNAYITLDINPSVEIITDEKGLVTQVNAINEDAQLLLVDTNFSGKTIDETIEAIINLATELGYIDVTAENAIIVTTAADNDSATTKLENKINDIIKKIIEKQEIKMEIINARHEAKQEMLDLAKSLNVSVGKLKLMQVVVELDPSLTLELVAKMAVKDLNKIVKDNRNEMKDLIKDEAQLAFIELKTKLHDALLYAKVELVYEAMNIATDDVYGDLISETTTTIEEIKTLYTSYYDEVISLKTKYDEAEIEVTINSDQSIIDLLEEFTNLQINNKPMNGRGQKIKEFRDLVKNRNSLSEVKNSIANQVEELMETIYPELEYRYIIMDNKITINIQYRNEYNKLKEKYEALFLEKAIKLEKLEELFIKQINEGMKKVKAQYQDKIDELKENAKNECEELKNQLKEHNQQIKDMWKNKK